MSSAVQAGDWLMHDVRVETQKTAAIVCGNHFSKPDYLLTSWLPAALPAESSKEGGNEKFGERSD